MAKTRSRHPWGWSIGVIFNFVALILSTTHNSFCTADIIALTDKTFDSVREAFNNPSMLIMTHSNEDNRPQHLQILNNGENSRAIEEFKKLSHDVLLKDKDVMLVTVDGITNRMLAARFGVTMNEHPTLIFLHSDRIFRYQGSLSSSDLMRSYALQGYQNQGMGEEIPSARLWLLIKTIYLDWLFNGDRWDDMRGGINSTAVLFSGFAVGISLCGFVAILVSFCTNDLVQQKQIEETKKKN